MAGSAMGSSPDRLSRLQRDLLEAFFEREQRFALTGGAALAGFHLGHRETKDLDLFARPPTDLASAQHALEAAAEQCGASLVSLALHPEFRRLLATRGEDTTLIDLVIDRAPQVDPEKVHFGAIRVDSLREIAANKICTLLARCEIRDLVDFVALLDQGVRLEVALADASEKDGGVNPATLAWLLDELEIGSEAPLPGNADPVELDESRKRLVERFRRLAFPGGPGDDT